MKKDQRQELREKTVEELQEMVRTNREQLLKSRIDQAVENNDPGMTARTLRRDIARYLTIINEKQAQQKAAEVTP